MHPAYSVIVFTTASGAGFGLLALLGVLAPAGVLPAGRWFGAACFALAIGLAVAGLVSSTFHLRRPSRAILAFSQWRSSWLSREGVAAVATLLTAGAFCFGWVVLGHVDGWWGILGVLAAFLAAATVISTGMIYAVLKPVRQWRDPLVVPLYALFALATGAAWLCALLALSGSTGGWTAWLAAFALAGAWATKIAYWRRIDRATDASTPESATGLGGEGSGRVRTLMWPHTEANYLLKEMGYRVARKHALKLRRVAVVFGAILPIALIGLAQAAGVVVGAIMAATAAAVATLGVLVERWLFFAEAKHTVTLYY